MAKQFTQQENKRINNYPSDFGSHQEMINKEETAKLYGNKEVDIENLPTGSLIVLTDDIGNYTTKVERIDNGLADVNRYSER